MRCHHKHRTRHRHLGQGRCDIEICPRDPNKIGLLIEIKISKAKKEPSSTNLKKIALSAKKQIKDKDYLENLRRRGVKKALIYGIAFYNKSIALDYDSVDIS